MKHNHAFQLTHKGTRFFWLSLRSIVPEKAHSIVVS
jgi:hypothetical protein